MNSTRATVLTKIPNFMNLGISSVHASDELGSFSIRTTRIGRAIHGSKWLPPRHLIGKVTVYRMSRTSSEQNYISKTDFETRRKNQYFGCQNISMNQPHLGSTLLGTNLNNRKTSPIESIPFGTKMPEATPRTLPTDVSEQNGKAHVPGDPDLDPSLSDSSSNKSNSLNYTNSSKSIKINMIRRKVSGTQETVCVRLIAGRF